jgi:hypothetical protein
MFMLAMLLTLAVWVDPAASPEAAAEVPKNFAAYFEREAEAKKQAIEDNRSKHTKLSNAYQLTNDRGRKKIKQQIEDTKREAEEIRKRPAVATMPAIPQVGDIGHVGGIRMNHGLKGGVLISASSPKLSAAVIRTPETAEPDANGGSGGSVFVVDSLDGRGFAGAAEIIEREDHSRRLKHPKQIPVLLKVDPKQIEKYRSAYVAGKKNAVAETK